MRSVSVSMEILEDRQLFSSPAVPVVVEGTSAPDVMSAEPDATDNKRSDAKQAATVKNPQHLFGELRIIAI